MIKITTYTYITPKDSREIQNKLVEWLEANLPDPYETASGKTRSLFVYGDDFQLSGVFPRIHVDIADFVPEKIAVQSKGGYLEREEHQFMIYYHNQSGHRFVFPDNNLKLNNEAQCRKYLGYIKDKIKANISDFDDYFHGHKFGTIPKPTFNPASSTYVSVLPFTVYTYRR